jgi:hypothetical protein
MKSASIERLLRRFEKRLGIDRLGRSVWVWLMPPLVGVVGGAGSALMPGIPDDFGFSLRLVLGVLCFVVLTAITLIYLMALDYDHNQQTDDTPRP